MKESVLKSLMRLFAIVAQVHEVDESNTARKIVEDYLLSNVRRNKIRQYQIMFDFYYNSLQERKTKTGDKQLSLLSVKSVIICEQVNQYLTLRQKIMVLIHILEIVSFTGKYKVEDIDFIKTLSVALKIEEGVFYDCMVFITGNFNHPHHKKNFLDINSKGSSRFGFRYMYRDFLEGNLIFLYFEKSHVCIFKSINHDDQLFFNELLVEPDKTYVFETGNVIKNPLVGTIFYLDVIKDFLSNKEQVQLHFTVENLSYSFDFSDAGIKPFNMVEESGQLIGIMGGSGVGKSTLLNLFNGTIKPDSGNIFINGYDLHNDEKLLKGLIGYIPQDDILIEELTVFQNLYYNACLCFRNLNKEQIVKKVIRLLHVLELYEIRDLKVGNPLNRLISGGQRKRLNIALELIREPQLLFVDEPTSGLSSTDSNKVIDLLKYQSLKGKLVFVNIHQPSSDIFKKFDKLLILDKGGRPIFHGPPPESMIYVKSYQQLVNADEGECPTCGNINPEQVLQILEMKKVNEYGEHTNERLIGPEDWYTNYSKNLKVDVNKGTRLKLNLPKNKFNTPSGIRQFLIFSARNMRAKLTDRQYVFINALEAPLLSLGLSFITRYNAGTNEDPHAYIFSENINVPVFIFISIVVALFLGLMVSAQEIIRDRKLLKRESFLSLSRTAYYNSKIIFVSAILAFQMLIYVLIGNAVFGIKGMLLAYWLVLWLIAIASATLGLILSASIKSVISIYILIPIVLIPQILFGGALIHFDKLNSKVTNPEYVPVIGDLIPSRWAYEALAVFQFKENKYEKELFTYDMNVSNSSYTLNYFIPQLFTVLSEVKRLQSSIQRQEYIIDQKLSILEGGLELLSKKVPVCDKKLPVLSAKDFNIAAAGEIERYLDCCRDYYILLSDKFVQKKDEKYIELEKKTGSKDAVINLRNNFSNENLSKIVLNKTEPNKILIYNGKIIRKSDPVFLLPDNKYGRTHLYSAVKRIGDYYIDTYWFNCVVLLLLFLISYFVLISEIVIKTLNKIGILNRNWLNYILKQAS